VAAARRRFTRAVERRMPRNGYHNAEHIADVVHSVAILLTGGLQDLVGLQDDPLCVLALLVAAAIHDFEHPGLTGDHLIAIGHEWALTHNDRAVLEQHHLAEAFRLLRAPGLDWAAGLAPAQRAALRTTVIDLVLGTDMKEHFKLLGEFGNVLHRARLSGAARRRRRRSSVTVAHAAAAAAAAAESTGEGGTGGELAAAAVAAAAAAAESASVVQATLTDAERLLVLKIAMKVADLGHLRAPQEIHCRWVAGLCDEFYAQGDAERDMGMRVNDLMCRERAAATPCALAESQVCFFDVIALPLVHHWAKATGARRWLERVTRNYEYWRAQRDALAGRHIGSSGAYGGASGCTPTADAFVVSARIAGLPAQLTIPEGAENMSGSTCSRPRSHSGGGGGGSGGASAAAAATAGRSSAGNHRRSTGGGGHTRRHSSGGEDAVMRGGGYEAHVPTSTSSGSADAEAVEAEAEAAAAATAAALAELAVVSPTAAATAAAASAAAAAATAAARAAVRIPFRTASSESGGSAGGGAPRRRRRGSCDSRASSLPLSAVSGSASDADELASAHRESAVCTWCGLPPLPGARRLSRDVRSAAAVAGAAAAAAASGGERPSDSSGAESAVRRRRRARFSETDACGGLRATRVQFEEFRRARSGAAAVAAVIAAGLAPPPQRRSEGPGVTRERAAAAAAAADAAEARDAAIEHAPFSDDDGDQRCRVRRTSDVSLPASALGRHRIGMAAAAAAAGLLLDDSAADDPTSAGATERALEHSASERRQARRSTGSVTFEFDDEFSERDDDPEGPVTGLDALTQLPRARGVSDGEGGGGGRSSGGFGGSEGSWGESEERFGQLCVARSVDRGS
jgi:hypothetical protein